ARRVIDSAVFSPFQPKVGPASAATGRKGVWGRIAGVVAKRPRVIWIGLVVLLALPLLAAPQFKASGVAQSEFVLGESEARDGQDVLAAHFPGGSGSPTQVVVSDDELESAAKAIGELDGVESMSVTTEDSPSGTATVTDDGKI